MQPLAHPRLDDFTDLYLRLALQLEKHIEGYVDAYYGPPELKKQVMAEDVPSPRMLDKAAAQLARELDDISYDDRRTAYLRKQVHAIEIIVSKLNGEDISYLEEVEGCFDVKPTRPDEQIFLAAIETLNDLIPGTGSLTDRFETYRTQFDIPAEKQLEALKLATEEVQKRTIGGLVGSELPDNEKVELAIVTDRPWAAFNWYQGQAQSKIEFNADQPINGLSIIDTMAHETYPGHHVEHAVKENLLYYQRGYGENSVLLSLAPESVISEGVANYGKELIYTRSEALEWIKVRLVPLLPKRPKIEIDQQIEIWQAYRSFDALGGWLAFLLYVDEYNTKDVVKLALEHSLSTEERIRASLKFLQHPLWRSYIFNYYIGESLVRAYVENGERVSRFQSLLQQQFWPSLLASK